MKQSLSPKKINLLLLAIILICTALPKLLILYILSFPLFFRKIIPPKKNFIAIGIIVLLIIITTIGANSATDLDNIKTYTDMGFTVAEAGAVVVKPESELEDLPLFLEGALEHLQNGDNGTLILYDKGNTSSNKLYIHSTTVDDKPVIKSLEFFSDRFIVVFDDTKIKVTQIPTNQQSVSDQQIEFDYNEDTVLYVIYATKESVDLLGVKTTVEKLI